MSQEGEVYKCDACGAVVYVLEGGGGDLVCCGEDMQIVTGDALKAFESRFPRPA